MALPCKNQNARSKGLQKAVEFIFETFIFRILRGAALFQILWEFNVREEQIAEFEKFYSPTGLWAKLFRGSPGYLGTVLLRDAQAPRRYVTIDRWENAASHRAMRGRFAKEYEALDKLCEALTESERQIGTFDEC